MCGIFGQYIPGQQASTDLMQQMATALAHRGPDGYGIHAEGPLAMGAGRLAIIDLAAPAGPLFNEDKQVGVVFNGEIYNHRALRQQLQAQGHVFSTATDTEVLVHAYEEWGEGLLPYLRGMFAFCIYDVARRRLLLARDRLGEKPLYYAQLTGGEFVFASEVKALLRHPGVHPRLAREHVPLYLTLGYTPPPHTLFAGIHKLGPGELLRVNTVGQIDRERYYLAPMRTPASISDDDYAASVTTTRRAVEDAVRSRMISDVPVGAFLSGGVDSTSVVALMQRELDQPLHTFTVGFDFERGGHGDAKFNVDAHYAQIAADALGTQHHSITIPEKQLADVLPHLIYQMDEPLAQYAIVQTAYVAALARQHGVPVLLTGDAGDELFLGYNHYRADRVLARYLALPGLLRNTLLTPLMARVQRTRELARKARNTDPVRRYLEWMRILSIEAADALRPENQQDVQAIESALNRELLPYLQHPDVQHFAERISYASLNLWLPEDSNMRVDKMAMLMSIEARAPLEDHHLAEWALSLPLTAKLRQGDFKRVYKDAIADLVPESILQRPKWGFTPPMSDWLRTVLRPLVQRVLAPEYVAQVGVFDVGAVQRIVHEHITEHKYRLKPLWTLFVFHLWHALYIDESVLLDGKISADDLRA
jgi:asparagine synthase (glutamine-hydrolysing)